MRLHHEVLGAPSASASALFLHGILGRGTNLRSMGRAFCEANPGWQAVLVDLRAHGQSQATEGDDTVEQAAADLVETFAGFAPPVTYVVGHSFGGKVALLARGLPELRVVLTLDSGPGARPDFRGSETTLKIVEHLASLPARFERREDFQAAVESLPQAKGLGPWLAMNLVRESDGLRFGLDLARIRALLSSYFVRDAWPEVEAPGGPTVHLVVGSRSKVYDAASLERARRLALESRAQVHFVDAGHWLHVEKPHDVQALVNAAAPT